MPLSVSDVFQSAGLRVSGGVRWGQPIPLDVPGVYAVSASSDVQSVKSPYADAPISLAAVKERVERVPQLTLNGVRPSPEQLAKRLAGFWMPDEVILYVGKAGTSLRDRVRGYYRTPLGDRRPHAGGHWLKTLSVLSDLHVFWAPTTNPERDEGVLLSQFVKRTSPETRRALFDPLRPFPFANLEYPRGNRKAHGIEHAVLRE